MFPEIRMASRTAASPEHIATFEPVRPQQGSKSATAPFEHVLEDELAPNAAASVHQRATLAQLPQLDGCEPELLGQGRHRSDRVLVVARQKDDPMAALDDRIGSQGGRNQVIEPFDEPGATE